MIRCIAVDDEPKALEVIRHHASKVDFLLLENSFTDPYQAISFVNSHAIDLIFLDINMPDINGMKILTHFKTVPFIIYTSAHSEYALASYEVEAIDYLLKPFDFSRFLAAATKVKERLADDAKQRADFFFINTGNQRKRIFYRDITHVQGDGNYVTYFTGTGQLLVRTTLTETRDVLPPEMFIQIHRSIIVSLQSIEKIENNHVYIAGNRLAIGPTYREKFMARINSLS